MTKYKSNLLEKTEQYKRQSENKSDRPEVSSTGGLSTKGAAAKLQEENKKVKTINKNDYEITKCKPSTMLSCIENL